MRVLAALLVMLALLAGCADGPSTTAGSDLSDPVPPDTSVAGAAPDAPNASAPLEVREATGASGSFILQASGTVSGSFNACQEGGTFRLPTGYSTVVAVMRWDPAESDMTLHLEGEGRAPRGVIDHAAGQLRATFSDLEADEYHLQGAGAAEVNAATTYDIWAAMVPPGIDPASVDPTQHASPSGGCAIA